MKINYSETTPYDVAIIGGGINGVAVARDAALRGLKVYLCEKGDLGQATSSASSKIAHGGLRYLEHYEFSLVRKGLKERETLLKIAPHLVRAIGYVLPYEPHLRPRWLIRLGLFLYDHLYQSKHVPRSHSVDLNGTTVGNPLKKFLTKGFMYHDGWMDDARIVALTAKGAQEYGATIALRTPCQKAAFHQGLWQMTVKPEGHKPQTIQAKTLVNATGPWAEKFLKGIGLQAASKPLTLIKGSHIVVPKLFDHDKAYILQNKDGRVVFAFPYEKHFSMLGTTDTPLQESLDAITADTAEIEYLCGIANHYFQKQTAPQDVVWHFSGARPLIDDGDGNASKASRDYRIQKAPDFPLINIWGGKFTSHRLLAEEVVEELKTTLGPLSPCSTATTPLPGGDFAQTTLEDYRRKIKAQYPWLPGPVANRFIRQYGTLTPNLLAGKTRLKEMGTLFGGDLYQAEVDYLCQEEWAKSVEDILWRRTKRGLHLSLAEQAAVRAYLKKQEGREVPHG